jgi:hypothetical protein
MVGIYSKYGSKESCTKGLLDSSKGRDHFEDLSVERGIILKWILKKEDIITYTEFIWNKEGPLVSFFEQNSKIYIKSYYFLTS